MLNQNVDFDAFSASIEGSELGFIAHLRQQIDLSSQRNIRPRNGYHYGAEIHRGDNKFCDILWGADHGSILVQAMGEHSSLIRSLTLGYVQSHRLLCSPTRIDARVDWDDEGLFDRISALFLDFATDRGLKINQLGNWHEGKERTLYIGSRQSQLMVRLYEKGWQVGGSPNWIRFETEVKPKKQEQRQAVLTRSASEVLYTGWAGEFLETLGFIGSVKTILPSMYQPSDDARARRALVKQYGRVISNWKHELGTWDELGKQIETEYAEQKELCHAS